MLMSHSAILGVFKNKLVLSTSPTKAEELEPDTDPWNHPVLRGVGVGVNLLIFGRADERERERETERERLFFHIVHFCITILDKYRKLQAIYHAKVRKH